MLLTTKKGIHSMASFTPVVTDTATLEEVIDVLQEHVPIEMEGDFQGVRHHRPAGSDRPVAYLRQTSVSG